jgi:hypothetical protein
MNRDGPRFSGQLRVRLPISLHRRVAETAAAEKVSMNQYICVVLAGAVGWSGNPRVTRRTYRGFNQDVYNAWLRSTD